ncbi:MAG: M1 family metallopeptidase [Bacteroidetes bacterium]|nr:M1 family metallopeptidase [Bacteroidota bacterium]
MRNFQSSIRLLVFVAASIHTSIALADTYPKNTSIDAINYAFNITLSDDTDRITVSMAMDVRFIGPGASELILDLINADPSTHGKGMMVREVLFNGRSIEFRHQQNKLIIGLSPTPAPNEQRRYVVNYSGIPASGLKIAKNKYGDRTFFSDNWPDLARNWLAVIDHPSDKATSEFLVTAPSHYQVVSNGLLVEQSDLANGIRFTHWKQSVPIAPWLYVLGVARFAVQYVDRFEGKSIETWVYAQDREAGFSDFEEPTKEVLKFYSDYVGPYAYERLANIQSNSVSGGMEAASAILYSETSVSGKKDPRWRNVVIHEIAHQWFGNAVTESDWDDVWLSEGFATYFTLLFIEHQEGRDAFIHGLKKSRDQIVGYLSKNEDAPIVHENLNDMSKVTSALTYQKGAWVLHMLRTRIGDAAFKNGIQNYYKRYFNGNATTDDFRLEMEKASNEPLQDFFNQWLRQPGLPEIKSTWKYDSRKKELQLTLKQLQSQPFHFTIEFGVQSGESQPEVLSSQITERETKLVFPLANRPTSITIDPKTKLLGTFKVNQE